MRAGVLLLQGVFAQIGLHQVIGGGLMPRFRRSEVAQKLARGRVCRTGSRREVEMLRLLFHGGGFGPDPIKPEILDQPDGPAGVIARNMLSPEQRDDIAEAFAVQVDQALAVRILFGGHAVENRRGVGIVVPQPFGISAVDLRIVFL